MIFMVAFFASFRFDTGRVRFTAYFAVMERDAACPADEF
jgi:hypothetical protein